MPPAEAGFLLPGNKVDVLLTVGQVGSVAATVPLVQNVQVLAVDQRGFVARSVTLLVTPEEVARLDLGQSKGTLHLALRRPEDNQHVTVRRPAVAELRLMEAKGAEPGPPAPPVPIRTFRGARQAPDEHLPAEREVRDEAVRRGEHPSAVTERRKLLALLAAYARRGVPPPPFGARPASLPRSPAARTRGTLATMTPLLLTLAGILPGDGGPGGGAAREAVEAAVKLDTFEGFIQVPGGPPLKARLEKGDLCVKFPGGCSIFFRCALTRDEAAGFRLEWAGNVFRGAASRGPGGAVLILRPAPVKAGGSDPRLLTDFLRRGGPAR